MIRTCEEEKPWGVGANQVMCVVSFPTFAPSPLRDAWGLVENRPALLRVVAPWAVLRAVVTPRARHGDRTRPARGPGVLERPRGSAYAGGFRRHMTSTGEAEDGRG
jgi:hypothetical protein